MKILNAFAVIVVIWVANAAEFDIHPLSDENIALINQKAKTWTAGKNFEIHEWERVKRIASGVLPRESKPKKSYRSNPHNEDEDVPDSFDAREAWSYCDSIKQIRDQSSCKSDWAFGAVSAMSDRICIRSEGQTKQYVSAEALTACCYGWTLCGYGCEGGHVEQAWEFWEATGIVTGGLYNSSQGCQDYSLPPCDHYVDGNGPDCESLVLDTPTCTTTCYDPTLDYEDSRTWGEDLYTFTNAKQMQLEIYKNGPIEATFNVYDDFVSYKSGIYQRTGLIPLGTHAIKIIGWGTENDTPYWLIANSWNTNWGDNGFFKMLRGENHCEIENEGFASYAIV